MTGSRVAGLEGLLPSRRLHSSELGWLDSKAGLSGDCDLSRSPGLPRALRLDSKRELSKRANRKAQPFDDLTLDIM